MATTYDAADRLPLPASLRPARRAPARAATQNAPVNANVVKPLTLTSLQNLDLGTITLGPGTWSSATVGDLARRRVQLRQRQSHLHRRARRSRRYNVTGTQQAGGADHRAQRHPGQPERRDQDADPGRRQSRARSRLTSSGQPGIDLRSRRLDHAQLDDRHRHLSRAPSTSPSTTSEAAGLAH